MALHGSRVGGTTIITGGGGGGTTVVNSVANGCVAVWETGLTWRVSPGTYYIGGTLYTFAGGTITLDAADATLDRFDQIVLNTSSAVAKVTGTAAASPSVPDIDPSTQLSIKLVLVNATVTTPTGVSTTSIYLENTEWASSSSGAGWTLNSTAAPQAGTVHIRAAAVAANGYVSLDQGAGITITDQETLALYLKPNVSFPNGRVLRLQWYLNGVSKGIALTVASGYWGFNGASLAYQFVAIPIANFVLPTGTICDQLRITVVGGALSFDIDNITLQSKATTISGGTGGITQDQADARYLKLIGGELTGDLVVPDEAYDATGWNGSREVPTKNAVRDKIETLVGNPTESLIIACSDETTAITTGTAKVTFRTPYAFTLSEVRASVTTAPTGSTIIIDINEAGSTILSTKLSIDASEKTSTTAASAAVISDTSLADDAEMTIDFDQVGSTIAGAGVKVTLIGTRT